MTSLRDHVPGPGESLADYIERLAVVVHNATPSVQSRYHTEILEWMKQPEVEALAAGLVGRIGIQEGAQAIFEKLNTPGLSPYDCNRYILALGQLGYEPAAERINGFLHGKTRAAATVALLLIDPERAAEAIAAYPQERPEEATCLVGIALLEHYEKNGMDGMSRRANVIPEAVIKDIKRFFELPNELNWFLEHYQHRRT